MDEDPSAPHASGDSRPSARPYANYMEVGFNDAEFVLEIGQFYADDSRPRMQMSFVTAPEHLRAFIELMDSSLARFEAQHRRVPPNGASR